MNDMVVHDGWEIKKLGELFGHRQERNFPTLPLLSVTGKKGVVSRGTLERRDTSNADKSKYLRVVPGDIAYNTMRMWQGVSGKSDKQGIVSPAYTVLQPKLGVCPDYAKYLFKLELLIQVFHRFSQGLVNDTLNLKYKNFAPIKVTLPPLPEQQKIAAILTSVDDVIEKIQAQINKLQDLKKGTMNELLTRGIGHRSFKESPVGMIPVGWEVVTYGSVLVRIDSGWSPMCKEATPSYDEWGVLKVSSVTRGHFLESESKTLPEHEQPRPKLLVKQGDVLLTRANGNASLVGLCVRVEINPTRKLMLSDKILRLVPSNRVCSVYLQTIFNAASTRKQIEYCWGGSSGQKNISQKDIKAFKLPLPPLAEQQEIASILASIDNTIEANEAKLQHTQALKKALLQDLLTGKTRVEA